MRYQKGTFITIPNKEHLSLFSAGAQALYIHLCDFANQDGECWPSRPLLAEKIGMSLQSVDRFIEELCEVGVIKKEHQTRKDGGFTSNLYQIIILPSPKNSTTPSPTDDKRIKPSIEPKPYNTIGDSDESQEYVKIHNEDEIPQQPKKKPKYPHSLEVFKLWGKFPANWRKNISQLMAAENLYQERGLRAIQAILERYRGMSDRDYCPQIDTPWDLDSKWGKLEAFFEKDGGKMEMKSYGI